MGDNFGISRPTSGSLNGRTDRYRRIASNLATLASERKESAAQKTKVNNVLASTLGIVGTIAGSILSFGAGSYIGGSIGTLAGQLIGLAANDPDNDKKKSELYAQMNQNLTSYLSNMTTRDTTIMGAMDNIYSSMDNLRSSYGDSFVNTMYNYYLAKSGMNSDAYSLLTGNFETFEDIGYGRIASDGKIFDTLTDGNQNKFNNIYAQLQLGDIKGNQSLLDSMVQSLYGADTEMAIQLRSYETELRNTLVNLSEQQSQMIYQAKNSLEEGSTKARGENISYAQQIGASESDAASSGLRGGTTANNANLARLQKDLGQIQRTASVAAIIGTLKYNIQNAQKNASSTAYSYRMAQQRAVTGALNSAVSSFNSIGRTAKTAERGANYYLDEGKANREQFEEGLSKSDESDKDRIFEATAR